eukprot:scaffold287792_cov15-Tisochrysis_lutea.AAC.1
MQEDHKSIQIGIEHQLNVLEEASKLARDLHAHSVQRAHKPVATSVPLKTRKATHSQVRATSNPPESGLSGI